MMEHLQKKFKWLIWVNKKIIKKIEKNDGRLAVQSSRT